MKMCFEGADGFLLNKKEVDEKLKELIGVEDCFIEFPDFPYGNMIEISTYKNSPYTKIKNGIFSVSKKEPQKFLIHADILKSVLKLSFPEENSEDITLSIHVLTKINGNYYVVDKNSQYLKKIETLFYHFSIIKAETVDLDEEPPIERIAGNLRKYALSQIDGIVSEDKLKQAMLDSDIMKELPDEIIRMLKRTGDIFEHKSGMIQKI